jgi:hypothetical protein
MLLQQSGDQVILGTGLRRCASCIGQVHEVVFQTLVKLSHDTLCCVWQVIGVHNVLMSCTSCLNALCTTFSTCMVYRENYMKHESL